MTSTKENLKVIKGFIRAELEKGRSKLKKSENYTRFVNLPNDTPNKALEKYTEFTLMVVGQSDLGKSTLINSFFLTDIQHSLNLEPTSATVAITSKKVVLKENGVNLLLTLVDTPGFGDAIDNKNCWIPIIEYIDRKYEEYLKQETRIAFRELPDQRVHCCLYLIQPGHKIKSLDIEFMKQLCEKVNVIPIIAKADTLTQDECIRVKKQFLNDIFRHGIKIYEVLNNCCGENKGSINKSLKLRVPFAVVGANTVVEKNGKKFRVRKYPWGIVEVDNLDHCDFLAMRNMITHTHLQKLKDNTNFIHYKKYRLNKLANIYKNLNVCEKEVNDLKVRKEEAEIRQASEANVKDRKQINEDREAELAKMCEMTKNNLKELENLRQKYEVDHEQYEKNEQIFRRRSLNKKECMLCRRY